MRDKSGFYVLARWFVASDPAKFSAGLILAGFAGIAQIYFGAAIAFYILRALANRNDKSDTND